MSTFHYDGTDENGAPVSGSIDADTADAARDALANLHISSQSVREASRHHGDPVKAAPPSPPPLLQTFAFEGKDPEHQIRRGTVQAESKYHAFEKLKHEQHLSLTMLSPVGVTPSYNDYELMNWQKNDTKRTQAAALDTSATPPSTPMPRTSKPSLSFSFSPQPVEVGKATSSSSVDAHHIPGVLASGFATLRVYAGWLLLWYGFFITLGHYAHERELPFSLPLVEAIYLSPLLLIFIVGTFLFVILHSIHRALHGRLMTAVTLSFLWIMCTLLVQMTLR